LFACDWAYGRIHAVFLEPAGASYRGRHEVFASGEPFPVTDLVAGLDGALYVAIGGRKAQSGLYRIAWAGAAAEDSEPIADPGADARARRRALERFHGPGSPFGEDQHGLAPSEIVASALTALGDPDRFVRAAARLALEHQDPSSWAPSVRAELDPRRALEGWLALVRAAPDTPAHEVVEHALAIFTDASAPALRLDALRLLSLALIRLDGGDAERARIRTALDGAYPGVDARLDRALLELLVACGADVVQRALGELEQAPTQEARIAILYALRALETGWSEARGRWLLDAFERELAGAVGGASVRGYLERLRDEARLRVGTVAATVGAASGTPTAETPAAEPTPAAGLALAGRSAHAWSLSELEPHLAQVAEGRDFARGRAAYETASCHTCHRLGGAGENLGPDLTGAAGRYSARDLLLATLAPSHEVPDVWRDLELWGADRLLAVGRLEDEREGVLSVRETAGTRVELEAAAVLERTPHRLSRMPEGLLDLLTGEEILDLLAYVLAGGDPADQRFR
jgi:putative heme-binding domain-containing protein